MARDQLRSKAKASKGNDYGEIVRQKREEKEYSNKGFYPLQIISVSINQYWSPSCDMTMSEMIQSGAYISLFIINFRQSQTWKNQRQRQPNRQDLSSQRLHRNPGAFFCFVFFLITCTRLYNPLCL